MLRQRNLSTTRSKVELIKRLMDVNPDGAWMDENDPVREGKEERDDELRLERGRNELLRQELEVLKRERDVAQREAAKA